MDGSFGELLDAQKLGELSHDCGRLRAGVDSSVRASISVGSSMSRRLNVPIIR